MAFLDPCILAQHDKEVVTCLPGNATKKLLEEIVDKYIEPQLLKINWSWGDRLLNSSIIYPYCGLNRHFTEARIWLSQLYIA